MGERGREREGREREEREGGGKKGGRERREGEKKGREERGKERGEGGRENLFVESEGPKPQKFCVPQRDTQVDWSSFQLAIIRHRMDLTCTDIAPSAKISLTDRDPT